MNKYVIAFILEGIRQTILVEAADPVAALAQFKNLGGAFLDIQPA